MEQITQPQPQPRTQEQQEMYKAPEVSREQHAHMSDVKKIMQVSLFLTMISQEDENGTPLSAEKIDALFLDWIEKHGQKLNDYFYEHPGTEEEDIEKVRAYLTHDSDTIMH